MQINSFKRTAAAAVSAALAVCTLCTPACAASTLAKDENVYVTLNQDGSVQSTTVSEWLHRDGGLNGADDLSILSDITNLKSDDMPQQDGTKLTWNTDKTDIYYQGKTSADTPVTAKITYYLDGKEITAEKAAGKSGHIKIDVALTNNSYSTVDISGKKRKVYTPFVAAIGTDLPCDSFTSVKAEKGTVQTDSSNQIVAFVCMPGMKATFDGLLSGEFADIQEKFLDSVAIEADVTDFSAPSIMIAYATDASLLEGQLDTDKFGDAFSDLDKLTNATQQLMDGANALADGTAQLRTGTQSLSSGAQQLSNGTASLSGGASTLSGGAQQLSGGASTLNAGAAALTSGLASLSGNSAQLNAGAQQIASGILASANTQLKAVQPNVETLTWENYAAVLGSLSGVTEDMLAQARAALSQLSGVTDETTLTALIYLSASQLSNNTPSFDDCKAAVASAGALMTQAQAAAADGGTIYSAQAALTAAAGNPLAVAQTAAVMNGIVMANNPQIPDASYITDDMRAAAYTSLAANLGEASDEQKALIITMACMDCASNGTAIGSAMTSAAALAQTAAYVQKAMTAAADGSAESAVKAFLTQCVTAQYGSSMQQAADLINTLAGVQTFVSGLAQYTAGVDSAYAGSKQVADGSKQVADAAAQIAQGAKQLSDGSAAAASGASQLANGASSAASGAAALDAGAKQLSDGVKQYKQEGVDKLTNTLEDYDIDGVVDTINAVRAAAADYHSFGGASDGTVTTTKFIMKTSAPAGKEEQETDTAETVKTEKTSLWTKIINLFKKEN